MEGKKGSVEIAAEETETESEKIVAYAAGQRSVQYETQQVPHEWLIGLAPAERGDE